MNEDNFFVNVIVWFYAIVGLGAVVGALWIILSA
jgi:hypothetical protein